MPTDHMGNVEMLEDLGNSMGVGIDGLCLSLMSIFGWPYVSFWMADKCPKADITYV